MVCGVSIDPELKAEAETILSSLGLTISQAVKLYLTQVVLHDGLPFDVCLPKQLTLQASQCPPKV